MEYVFNKDIYPSSPQDYRTIRAKKLVVVAAGAMNSPLILERSGIGRSELLQEIGIPLVADIPGVGAEYQGQILIRRQFHSTNNVRPT